MSDTVVGCPFGMYKGTSWKHSVTTVAQKGTFYNAYRCHECKNKYILTAQHQQQQQKTFLTPVSQGGRPFYNTYNTFSFVVCCQFKCKILLLFQKKILWMFLSCFSQHEKERERKKKKKEENNSVLPACISPPNLREPLPMLAAVTTENRQNFDSTTTTTTILRQQQQR